jgi:hypothetical protein
MYVCMYVCMYACMHVCMYIWFMRVRVLVCVCVYVCMYVCELSEKDSNEFRTFIRTVYFSRSVTAFLVAKNPYP